MKTIAKSTNNLVDPSFLVLFLALMTGQPANAVVRQWVGSSSGNWATGANWTNGTPPTAGDDLVFPAGITRTTMSNLLTAGTVFNSITFRGSNYIVSGNAIGLTGGIRSEQATNVNRISIDIALNAPQTFECTNANALLEFLVLTDINLGTNTLTIDAPRASASNVLHSVASLLDPGLPGCGPSGFSGPITNSPHSYSFSIPSNSVFSVRVAGLCESYSLRVDGFECPVELGIGRAGSNVRIDWPSHGLGYRLECATNLPATDWVNVPGVPVIEDGSFVLSNNIVNPHQYYRLVKP